MVRAIFLDKPLMYGIVAVLHSGRSLCGVYVSAVSESFSETVVAKTVVLVQIMR